MVENGYRHSTPRADKFPAGLRVLVVDDDPTWLKILEKMLRKCSYEVTTCCLARDALRLLRERKDGFDLVISDVNMPDMDGFKLLEHVGLELDLPVIMMSVNGETSRVMKGVQHGACDYLLKPIRMKELSNIWQHVLRKRLHEGKDTDYYEYLGNFQLIKNKVEQFHENGGKLGISKKRKEMNGIKHDDDQLTFNPSTTKKARVIWTVDLHQKFVDAVKQIGFDKVGPKKILDAIKVPGLTREHVASHLQKFRLYLSRLQKENELKASSKPTSLFAIDGNNATSDTTLQQWKSVPHHHIADVELPRGTPLKNQIDDHRSIDIHFLLQEYDSNENIWHQNCYYDLEPFDELQTDSYGELAVHWNNPHDLFEGTFVDQSSFIA